MAIEILPAKLYSSQHFIGYCGRLALFLLCLNLQSKRMQGLCWFPWSFAQWLLVLLPFMLCKNWSSELRYNIFYACWYNFSQNVVEELREHISKKKAQIASMMEKTSEVRRMKDELQQTLSLVTSIFNIYSFHKSHMAIVLMKLY